METTHWITVTILLTILAELLQVAGYVAPMWIWVEVDTFQVGVGFWYITGCGYWNRCNTTAPDIKFGYTKDDTFAKPQYDAVRALETLGLAGGILLVLFLIVYRIGYAKWDRMDDLNRTAFILCVLTWLVILAGLIVFCGFYWPVVGTSPLLSARSFPWSLLLCLFAAFLFIVICVLIRVKCRTSQYVKHAIPTSGDSKMDLNPVTKTGLLSRYFTPSPYREDRRTTYALSAYYDEGVATGGMTRRLIGPEERSVSAIDNVAFQGNTVVANGMSYRYLPVQNGGVTQTETVVRRTLPSRVFTYSSDATDINQLQPQQLQQQAANTTTRVVNYVNGDVHPVANQAGQGGGLTYVNGGIPSPRDSGQNQGAYTSGDYTYALVGERTGNYASRPGGVTTTQTFVTRDSKLADNTTDERFTREGRLMANVNPDIRRDRGVNSQWDASTSATSGATRGQYTTHTLLQQTTQQVSAASRIMLPAPVVGGSVNMYDPTYIYRPYSEQIY